MHGANGLKLLPPSGSEVGSVEVNGRGHGVGKETMCFRVSIWNDGID